jgi:hypothetical protein
LSLAVERATSIAPALPLRALPWLLGTGALLPLLLHLPDFQRLFYFQDELDQVHTMDRDGLWSWALSFLGENWVPVFKLTWAALIYLHGSYFVLIGAVWLLHAVNVGLLARLIQLGGGGTLAMSFAAVLLGLPWFNIETLAWAVRLTAVMSVTCLLGGLLLVAGAAVQTGRRPRRLALGLAILSFLSATSFAQGILAGPVLALAAWFMLSEWPWRQRLAVAAAAVAPALVVAAIMMTGASGNHQALTAEWQAKVLFAAHAFGANPWRWLAGFDAPAPVSWWLGGVLKLAIFGAALLLARRSRGLILALLAFEVGNTLLLGLGRYHTGLETTVSWRYQYTSLLTLAPALAWLGSALATRWPSSRTLRVVAAVALAGLAWHLTRPWGQLMPGWSTARGGVTRDALRLPHDEAPESISGVPWIDNARTRELVERYNLH